CPSRTSSDWIPGSALRIAWSSNHVRFRSAEVENGAHIQATVSQLEVLVSAVTPISEEGLLSDRLRCLRLFLFAKVLYHTVKVVQHALLPLARQSGIEPLPLGYRE